MGINASQLIVAAIFGDVERAKHLLELGVSPNDASRAIYAPVRKGNVTLVKLLLDHGADPNYLVDGKLPLLRIAVLCHQTESTRLLLQHGADPNAHNIVLCAVETRGKEIVRLLLEYGATAKNEHIRMAAELGDLDIVVSLLAYGANSRAQNRKGRSARTIALWYNKIDIVNLFDTVRTREHAEVLEHRAGGQVLRMKMRQFLMGVKHGTLVQDPLFDANIFGLIWNILSGDSVPFLMKFA